MAEQLIYLEPGDDIASAVDRLQKARHTEIVLVVPRRALLLQSLVNLKVLAHQAEKIGRQLVLVTQDELGRNLAEQAGLQVLDQIRSDAPPKPKPVAPAHPVMSEADTDEPEVEGFKGTVNDYQSEPDEEDDEDELEGEDLESESDFDEEPEEELDYTTPTNTAKPFWMKRAGIKRAAGRRSAGFKLPRLVMPKWKFETHHKIAAGFILLGLIVLGSVGFFVLPKAYVALEVQSEVFQKQFTLNLVDERDLQTAGSNVLPGRFIEVSRETVSTFNATGEENKGNKAEGQITILNYTKSIQGLLANTRFEAAGGLVFRLKNEVLVPPSRGSSPGTVTVGAIADAGGTKYNIGTPNRLTIPGLGPAGVDVVYGEVKSNFAGGTDDIVKVVSEDDITKAKEEAAKNIFSAAETELAKQLKKREKLDTSLIQNDIIDAVPTATAGAKRDTFDIRVRSRSWTILVSDQALAQAIANAAAFELPEDKQITRKTVEGAAKQPIESNFLNHRVSLLVKLDGRMGPKLNTEEIVSKLANQPVAEAEQYLSSLNGVANSSIEMWPSILPKIPLLHNNIRVQIIYLGE